MGPGSAVLGRKGRGVSGLITQFVVESNRIEGITRPPIQAELDAHMDFIASPEITVKLIEGFVMVCAGASLRTKPGMNVRVGKHQLPPGGPLIKPQLEGLLLAVKDRDHPFLVHRAYETLHPFMDGNGRSGRAIWAWQMINQDVQPRLQLGFLHAWYYQSLEHSRW